MSAPRETHATNSGLVKTACSRVSAEVSAAQNEHPRSAD